MPNPILSAESKMKETEKRVKRLSEIGTSLRIPLFVID